MSDAQIAQIAATIMSGYLASFGPEAEVRWVDMPVGEVVRLARRIADRAEGRMP